MRQAFSAFCLFFLVSSTVVAQQSFDDDLWQATTEGDSSALEELVTSKRLAVKPVLENWITLALQSGEEARTSRLEGASVLAAAFSKVFGEQSLELMVEAASRWDEADSKTKILADSLYRDAVSRRGVSDERPSVREALLQSEELYRSIDDDAGLAATLGQLGYIGWFLDRDAYLTYNEAALVLRREIGDLQLMGNTLNDLGLYHRAIEQDYQAALDVYLESESIRWAIGDSLLLSKTLPNIALSYELLGDFDNALAYYHKGADLYWAVGDTARYITQRNSAALILTDYLERHSDGLVEMLRLKEEMRAINHPRTEAVVTMSIGIVSRRLGDFQNAIVNYQDVIRLSEEHEFDDLLAAALLNIGVMFVWMDRPDRAVTYLDRAWERSEALELHEDALLALLALGTAHAEMKQFETSIEFLEQARRMAHDLDHQINLSNVEISLGNTKLKSIGPEEAEPHYTLALNISREFEVPDLEISALFGMGDMEERRGNPDKAYSWYVQASEIVESARGLQMAEEDKAGYLAQSRYLFEDVVDFLTKQAVVSNDQRWLESAFDFAEQAKARAFVDQLAEALVGVREGVDQDVLDDQQILTDNLVYLREELTFATERSERDELKALIREQEEEFDRVERDLRASNPAYARLRYPKTVTFSDFQNSIGSGELILSYSVGDSSSTLWAVSREASSIYELPARPELNSQIDLLRFALQDPSRGSAESYASSATTLYEMLVTPAQEMVFKASRVIIIPDDVLNYVPFEALVSETGDSYSDHTYLLSDVEVAYVQSATVHSQLSERTRAIPSRDFLAVGNPDFGETNNLSNLRGSSLQALPFSGEEVSGIASLFGEKRRDVFTGESATESAIQDAVRSNRYRYVHFATHGLINDDRPDYSALALAQGSTRGEGLLQASEIFNLPFESDLVVLSACETGLGQLIKGEGMVGLTRAFMYAGASSLVVSLWSVADASTSQLMQHFYSNLIREDQPKSQALRNAKLELLKSEETSHPFYWAPFVLIGEAE